MPRSGSYSTSGRHAERSSASIGKEPNSCLSSPSLPRDLTSSAVSLRLLLSYEEAAAALALSRAALRDLVYKGRGPIVTKIGRRTLFSIADLEAFIEEHREISRPAPPDRGGHPRRSKRGRRSIAQMMKS